MTFASPSVTEHLLRGLFGLMALVVAFVVMTHESLWSIPLALVGVVLLRDCPTCWTIGLMETLTARSTAKVCADGACGIRPSANRSHPRLVRNPE